MEPATEPIIHLVDDDDAVRDSLKTLLESYGMSVRDYGCADDFLNNLDPSEKGCLILDLHLPILGGLELIRIMRQRKIGLPALFITGRGDCETRARALAAGAIAFLEKPVVEAVLIPAIHSVLAGWSDISSGSQAGAETTSVPLSRVASPS